MSIALDTLSSPVVDGRCTGCGRFIRSDESHFHGPKRKFRGPPKAHLFDWDGSEGGMVTRCDDPAIARPMLLRKYAREVFESTLDELDQQDRAQVEAMFPEGKGEIQRGRVNVIDPMSGEIYTWWWMRLDDNAKGPGVTTAVVWSP